MHNVERWAPVILADTISRPRRDKSSAGSGGVVTQKPGRREKSIPRRAPLRDAFGTRANACVRVFARDSTGRAGRNESRLRLVENLEKSRGGGGNDFTWGRRIEKGKKKREREN